MRIYGIDGRLIGAICRERLQFLMERAERTNDPASPETSEAARTMHISETIRYYTTLRSKCKDERRSAWEQEWTWDSEMTGKIIQQMGVESELGVTPLTAHMECEEFFSRRAADSYFGAHDNQNQTMHAGTSLLKGESSGKSAKDIRHMIECMRREKNGKHVEIQNPNGQEVRLRSRLEDVQTYRYESVIYSI